MQSTTVARLRTDKGIPRLRDSVNVLNISVARLLLIPFTCSRRGRGPSFNSIAGVG